MTSTTLEPLPAVVQPRVISRQSGQSVLLEDAVRLAAEQSEAQIVWIVGGPGSGKTTALRHLAAVLPAGLSIRLVDDFVDEDALNTSDAQVLIATRSRGRDAPEKVGNVFQSTFPLAPWTTDDLIEYLLHAHPRQCRSVMTRLKSVSAAECYALASAPELWRVVLDRMA
jgi:ABC-type phosphate/phosphonate transport system ATPase subunit